MTKKDFELIASVLHNEIIRYHNFENQEYSKGAFEKLQDISKKLCDKLASKNPRFQKDKFLKACGVDIYACNNCKKICNNYHYHKIKESDKCLCEQCLA